MNKFFIVCLLTTIFLESQPEDFHTNSKFFGSKKKDDDDNNIEYSNGQNYKNDLNPTSCSSSTVSTITQPIIIDSNNSDYNNISNLAFQENIIYNPSPSYKYSNTYSNYPAAIIVAKDNITIDLVGFTLSLDSSVTTNPIHGIAVMPGVKNLKIVSSTPKKNKGCITGFSGYGIYMLGQAANSGTIDGYNNTIKCALIDNLSIMQNKNGISITNAIQPTVSNCSICYNYSSQPIYGINLSSIIDGYIENCKVNLNISSLDVYGINLQNTTGIIVENSQTNFNRSITSGNAIGINITGSSSAATAGNKITHCKATGNLCANVTGKESIGFSINNPSHHNIIEQSSALAQSKVPLAVGATAPTVAPNGYGIKINNSGCNNIIENKAAYNDNYGFYDSISPTTSLYFNNMSILNKIANYYVFVSNSLSIGYLRPLPTIIVYQDMIPTSNYSYSSFNNLEVR